MKLKLPLLLAGCAGTLCLAFAVGNTATAHEGHDHGDTTATTTAAEVKERIRGKLTEARKQACESRAKGISKILSDAAAMGQRHINLFGDITTKVETFYATKKLSASGYDAAVAKVNTQKSAAQSAVAAVKTASTTTIDCSGSDPIGQVDSFKDLVKAMHSALKDYRSAVKDLIVVVRQAAAASKEAQ